MNDEMIGLAVSSLAEATKPRWTALLVMIKKKRFRLPKANPANSETLTEFPGCLPAVA